MNRRRSQSNETSLSDPSGLKRVARGVKETAQRSRQLCVCTCLFGRGRGALGSQGRQVGYRLCLTMCCLCSHGNGACNWARKNAKRRSWETTGGGRDVSDNQGRSASYPSCDLPAARHAHARRCDSNSSCKLDFANSDCSLGRRSARSFPL